MKRTLFAFLFLFPVLLSAQFRIVGTGLFTTVNDSTYRAKIDFRPDLTGFSYNPTQMNDSMYVLSQRGQLYRLDSFYNATFSSAFIIVVEKNGNWGSPVGQVMVFQNNSSLAAPQAVYGANGATAGMQAGVDTWNALLLKVVADSASYWNEAYSAIVDSIWFSGTATKTLNMVQRGGDTLTASFVITGGADSLYVAENTGTTLLTNGDTLDLTDYPTMPFDSITFTTTAENTALEGELTYNNQSGTLVLGMAGGIEMPIGQGEAHIVRNSTGTTIQKGKVVYISGATGQRPQISLSDADTEVGSSVTFGITAEAIAANDSGFVFTSGYIKGINTNSLTEGEALWLDTIPGGFTHTKPTAPVNSVLVGYVITKKSNGTIFVKIQNGYEIDELHNVVTAGKVNNSVIRYDNATALWKASTTAGIVAGDTAAMLSSYISNADTSVFARNFQISGTSGQVTYFNGDNTVTGDANLTWSAANRTLGINTTTTSGANIIIKNTQEPVRDAAWLPNQTFGADTTNWTRGTGWTFNGTQAVATAATGALTYTTLPDTIISGRAYEVTYTLASYSAGTVTVAVGNATLALPAHNVTANVVLLTPTSATGGFRFTTSTFTGNLDNVAVVEVRNPASVLLAGQDDGSASLYNPLRMPNSSTLAFGGGGLYTTGNLNTFLGFFSGEKITTGSGNSFIGTRAGSNNTTGVNNVFIGVNTGFLNTTGSNNMFFGAETGYFNTIGVSNTFIGPYAGYLNKTGNNNNFISSGAGRENKTGNNNNFIGTSAGRSNTTGSNNISIGANAAYNTTESDTLTGSNNISIGSFVAGNIASSASGNLVLGNSVNLPTGNGSNQVVIKNLIFGTGASGTGTTIQTTAKAGINVNNPQSTLDVEGNIAIGATYSGTTAAPTNGLIVEGNTGIGTSSPQRRLHITGTVRVDTLTRDVPTRIVGADADGDLAAVTLGTGLSIASGTLSTSAILPADTSVFARDFQINGTGGYVPKFTTSSTIANSALYNPANNKVMIGHTSGNSLTNNLEIHSASNDAIAQPSLDIYLGNNNFEDYTPYVQLYRNRSTTLGGVTKVNNGDWLGRLTFQGADGAKYVRGAQIYALIDATTGLDSMPTAMRFATNSGTTLQPTDRMSITSAGRVGIGTTSPSRTLHVNSTDALKLPAGTTAERPSVGITGDLRMNTSPAADSLEYYNGASWVTVQDKLQNPVTGTGTANYLPKFTGASSVGNSPILNVADNQLVVGHNAVGTGAKNVLEIRGTGNTDLDGSKVDLYVNSSGQDYHAPIISLRRSRGATAGAFTKAEHNDWLGQLLFNGADGDEYTGGAGIRAVVDSITGNNDMPASLYFLTTPNGSSSLTTRMTINNAGRVGIGTTSPNAPLTVIGASSFGGLSAMSGRFSDNVNSSLYISHSSTSGPVYSASITSSDDLAFGQTTTGGGTTEYMRIKASTGRVGIGTTSPSRTLHISATDALKLPAGTTAERPSVGITGDLRMNTSPAADSLEYYNGASWVTVQDKLQNPVTGTGTANYLPKFTGASSIGNSVLYNQYNNRVSHGNAGYSQFLSVKNAYHLFGYGSTADDQPIHFIEGHVGTTATYAPQLRLLRGRTTTGDAGGRVQFGDYLGYMSFWPNENVLFNQPSAYIAAVIDSITGANDFPTSIRFAVAPNGSEGAVERVTINNAGRLGIATTSPARSLHVEGEARISDLTTDTPTRIVGADADGDLGAITLGTGLSISSGTLNASGITSVYIPINLFSPGDTVTNTTNAKNFFLVHSGLNGYCIDSYTVKAIAGTGTADIQVDKNDTGGNLQAISGTTVYTKDTNIALVTGDYIRGQVFNLSGTLIGLGLTLEIKATCN